MCCLGFGPLIALLSAVGASFLVNDSILAPLLVVMLVLGAVGLFLTRRRHGKNAPLVVHLASALTVFLFTFLKFLGPLVWVGIAGLLGASIWDFILGKRAH
jgi:hypothetical protein